MLPWLDRRLPLYRIPEPKTTRYPTAAPLCRASQLRVSQGRSGAALGTYYQRVVFTNVSARTCLLRGYPSISAVGPDGIRRTLRSRTLGTGVDNLVAADLTPGQRGLLDLASADQCYPAVHLRRPVFTLPHGGSVAAGDRFALLDFCGLSWSALGKREHIVEFPTVPGTAGSLAARIQVPARARSGATLRFVVTLGNPTGRPVVLRRCPGYTVGLYAEGAAVLRSYLLNCAVRTIRPHAAVRYEMRLAVPRNAKPGIAKLSWNLDTPTGPFAGGVVTIDTG